MKTQQNATAPMSQKLTGEILIIPVRDADGKLCSMQFIGVDDAKRF
jgi:phage/plasmid primase-like uncharacterized protein